MNLEALLQRHSLPALRISSRLVSSRLELSGDCDAAFVIRFPVARLYPSPLPPVSTNPFLRLPAMISRLEFGFVSLSLYLLFPLCLDSHPEFFLVFFFFSFFHVTLGLFFSPHYILPSPVQTYIPFLSHLVLVFLPFCLFLSFSLSFTSRALPRLVPVTTV